MCTKSQVSMSFCCCCLHILLLLSQGLLVNKAFYDVSLLHDTMLHECVIYFSLVAEFLIRIVTQQDAE